MPHCNPNFYHVYVYVCVFLSFTVCLSKFDSISHRFFLVEVSSIFPEVFDLRTGVMWLTLQHLWHVVLQNGIDASSDSHIYSNHMFYQVTKCSALDLNNGFPGLAQLAIDLVQQLRYFACPGQVCFRERKLVNVLTVCATYELECRRLLIVGTGS